MKSPFECVDCHADTSHDGREEYYMVHDEVWALTGLGKHTGAGMLCIGCLEQRIGRELTPDDFTDAPINWIFPGSSRLEQRQGRG